MTPQQFIAKWRPVELTERQAAQEHFIDLCRLFGHPTPIEADPTGETYCFEKGAMKASGNPGIADVWKRDAFAWEYKKKKKNLDAALGQIAQYVRALESPPVHVACDTNVFRVVTAFNNAPSRRYDITLDELADPEKRAVLEAVFHDPKRLREPMTREVLTAEAADAFATVSASLQSRHHDPEGVAHFVNQLVFCLFAEDVRLLPEGLFTRVLARAAENPARAKALIDALFAAMETGGDYGADPIAHVNGGLFDGRRAYPLTGADLATLLKAAKLDWSLIDPTIFGTLFERFLEPEKRAQIGAHYTDAAKIALVLEPVLLRPLRAEWEAARERIAGLLDGTIPPPARPGGKGRLAPRAAAEAVRGAFLDRLATLTVLDPACGSGNFLYLALQGVKDLEFRANAEAEALGLDPRLPLVGPEVLHGLEVNPIAAELARTTVWIGHIQWNIARRIYAPSSPVLRRLDTVECRDALVTAEGGQTPWPAAEFIVGNPPFLGGKLLRKRLGDAAVNGLFRAYAGEVPQEADLVTYWVDRASREIAAGRTRRAGFVTTNSIRGGANRRVLASASAAADLFDAWADEPWIVDGAAVRVSILAFARSGEGDAPRLDGHPVAIIRADLTAEGADLASAARLPENAGVAFMGDTKGGAFDVPGDLARAWLRAPLNPNRRPNADVLRPWANGLDVTRRGRDVWIIDFGTRVSEADAAFYEAPFDHVAREVKPERDKNRRETYRNAWWRHVEPRPALMARLAPLARFIATPRVAKHRLFAWLDAATCPDSQIIAIARDDDMTFGVLHSRFHETWALRLGTWLGVGNDPRYTPTTTFETFPFPDGLTPNLPAAAFAGDPRAERIAHAARALTAAREAWLNPPDLARPEPNITPTHAPGEPPRTYPLRLVPVSPAAAEALKARTLTALYNARPAWLAGLHDTLDRAVAAAYGWPETLNPADALTRLLALNAARAGGG